MSQNKEQTYVSAVAYLHNDAAQVQAFLTSLNLALSAHFVHYEIILVNDASRDDSAAAVKNCVKTAPEKLPVTLVNMSVFQGVELCMNAGIDAAIGDFIFEFDSLCEVGEEIIVKAYETALTGYDIVSVSPQKNRNFLSGMFYRIFNACSATQGKLQTDVFRVLSRRAINRVHAVSPTPVYRKAAYAASGLKMTVLRDKDAPKYGSNRPVRLSLAVDSLALYTNAAYRFSLGIAGLMLLGTLGELIYTLAVYLGGAKPIEGWTTTMFVLTVGFFGVFAILAIVLKYLSLLVDLVFKHQRYLVENIEKLQK